MTNAELHQLLSLDRSHLPEDGRPAFNRLIFSHSPYLLQHARNPVNWREWGPDAQQEAAERNLPLFVSIGYATCHWCHVMAHESFEDDEVADILNHAFVPVKVDREERPDLDTFCMAACQTLTGSGGWPLNCFLKPDGTPFYALTYLPKAPRHGMPGFLELLENIASVWQHRPDAVERNAQSLLEALERQTVTAPDTNLPDLQQIREQATRTLHRLHDPQYHGFGNAPKFPMPPYLLFLLRSSNTADRKLALDTLDAMRAGGIWDQLGGGIHRYSTDRNWLVPHFEKMLYDQALVAYCACEAYAVTADAGYLAMAENLCTFVLHELIAPEGGFYCGLDADSEGHEGTCYIWSRSEIEQLLGTQAADFCDYYGVTGNGNFEDTGKHVLFQTAPKADLAATLADARLRLLEARTQREQPLRDVKILCGWNGLMIAALARLATLTGSQYWLTAAQRAVDFVRSVLVRKDGRLLRSWCNGSPSGIPAFLEDYGFLAWGLLELHRAGNNPDDRQWAEKLCRDALRLFQSPDGRLNTVGCDQRPLPIHVNDTHDGVIPASQSALAMSLALLAETDTAAEWHPAAAIVFKQLLPTALQQPINCLWLLMAWERFANETSKDRI